MFLRRRDKSLLRFHFYGNSAIKAKICFIFFNPVSVIVDLIIVAFEVAGLWFIKNVYMYLSLLILSSSLIYWIIITTAPKDAWMIALVIIPITIGYVVLSILKILINQLLLSKKIKEQLIK